MRIVKWQWATLAILGTALAAGSSAMAHPNPMAEPAFSPTGLEFQSEATAGSNEGSEAGVPTEGAKERALVLVDPNTTPPTRLVLWPSPELSSPRTPDRSTAGSTNKESTTPDLWIRGTKRPPSLMHELGHLWKDHCRPLFHRNWSSNKQDPNQLARSKVQERSEPVTVVQAGLDVSEEVSAPEPAETRIRAVPLPSVHEHRESVSERSCSRCQQNRGPGIVGWVCHRWNDHCKPWLQENWWGYAEEFEEQPLGASVQVHRSTQVAKGEAAQMVLYRYDFADGKSDLTNRGKRQLKKIADLLPKSFAPVIIEETDDEQLDKSRREAIQAELAKGSFPVPPERVVVGPPRAMGLSGSDAVILKEKFTKQLSSERAGSIGDEKLGGASAGSSTSK